MYYDKLYISNIWVYQFTGVTLLLLCLLEKPVIVNLFDIFNEPTRFFNPSVLDLAMILFSTIPKNTIDYFTICTPDFQNLTTIHLRILSFKRHICYRCETNKTTFCSGYGWLQCGPLTGPTTCGPLPM